MKCPVCDYPLCYIETLLGRIEDIELLKELACDMAGRVLYLTPDATLAYKYLKVARMGDYEALWGAIGEVTDMYEASSLTSEENASQALYRAVQTAMEETLEGTSRRANETGRSARKAKSLAEKDYEGEYNWQMNLITQVVCNCPRLDPEGISVEGRSRISTLAG